MTSIHQRAINYSPGELASRRKTSARASTTLNRRFRVASNMPGRSAHSLRARASGNETENLDERNRFYAEAESRFLKALKIDPAVLDINSESVNACSAACANVRPVSRTRSAPEKAEQITPARCAEIINLAMLYFQKGKAGRVQSYFRRSAVLSSQALDGTPSDFWTRFDLAAAQLVLGRTDEAQRISTRPSSSYRTLTRWKSSWATSTG
jgi:Flp pilus assembly protein TadD